MKKKFKILISVLSVTFTLISFTVARTEEIKLPNLSGKSIIVYYMASETYDVAARQTAPEFEKLTGCKVTVVADPYAILFEKQLMALATGSKTYDVLQVAYQWDGQFIPFLEPLDNYIKEYGIDMEKFIPGVLNNCGGWYGTYYGIPTACDVYSIIYRTDVFIKAALTPPGDWEEFNTVAEKLTRGNMYGSALAGLAEQVGQFWRARYITFGGHLLNKDWIPVLDMQIGVKASKLLKDLLSYCPKGTLSYGYPEQMQSFVSGKVAMTEVWPSFLRGSAGDPKKSRVVGKWAFFPYPGKSGELSAWSLAIPKASKNKNAAFVWITYFTNREHQIKFFKDIGIGPTRTFAYKDPTLAAAHPDLADIYGGLVSPVPRFRVAQSQEAYNFLDDRVSAFLSGQISTEEMIRKVTKKWTDLFKKNKPKVPYIGP
ncbi:extracellular solute-binding protein [Patescibacteria group bacterium]|nr:extracellular solute-binding protein [Patescibacteria group bacterium]